MVSAWSVVNTGGLEVEPSAGSTGTTLVGTGGKAPEAESFTFLYKRGPKVKDLNETIQSKKHARLLANSSVRTCRNDSRI